MANLRNIDAEIGADFIGDDQHPALIISNACGPGLHAKGLVVTSNASIDFGDIASVMAGTASVIAEAAGTVPLTLGRTAAGNYSTGILKLAGSSVASGAVIELTGTAFVSVTTIQAITGAVAKTGVIRVKLTDGDNMGWIPVYPDTAVTAATWE